MEIKDLLKKELMIMDLKASTKMEAIDEMVAKLKEKNIISDEVVFKDLLKVSPLLSRVNLTPFLFKISMIFI